MGDSDDEYNRHHNNNGNNHNHNNSNNNNSNNGPSTMNSSSNHMNNQNKKYRDKFYKERDDGPMSNMNQNNPNNNSNNYNKPNNNFNDRREWNNDRGRTNDWKGRPSGPGGMGGSYQRSSSDYSRKHQSPPSHHYDSPPHKRNRRDWEASNAPGSSGPDYSSNYSSNSSYSSKTHSSSNQNQNFSQNQSQNDPEYPTQPPMLSFKTFLHQQDDNISDDEAIKKYNEYKIDFKKTQINKFFLEHKEEEWFKLRYHPDENFKRRHEQNQLILNRLEAFMDLHDKGWLENVACEFDKSKELTKFLDAVVIKLEGGNDEDIKKLLSDQSSADKDDKSKSDDDIQEIKKEEATNDDENKKNNDESKNNEANGDDSMSSNRKNGQDSGSESGAYSDSDSDAENKGERKKKKQKLSKENGGAASSATKQEKKVLHKTVSIFMRNLAPSVTKQDIESLCKNYEGLKRVALSDPQPERGFLRRGWITFDSNVDIKKICWSLQNIKIKDTNPGAIVNRELSSRIRPISNLVSHHKQSVKNDIKIAMKIIENMDKRWNLWQEKSDQKKEENVETNKENNSNNNNAGENNGNSGDNKDELNDSANKQQQENDLAKLEESAFCKLEQKEPIFLAHKFNGSNPLLENITDYLVDEISAEEEELLGEYEIANSKSNNKSSGSIPIDLDSKLNHVLDKLILYLRVVHSIDYYNSVEYQLEDSMPNRCGIIFVRPSLPTNAATASLRTSQEEINQYSKQMETKMKPYSEFKEKIDVDMAKKLGIKEFKDEIEKFIKLNTQELAPDRWLCPLSGKRFKGPEFIRKHLFYKHMEKIIEVKKEVEYFNNYIFDNKRPQLPEHPSNKSSQQSGSTTMSSSNQSYSNQNMMHSTNQSGYMGSPMISSYGSAGPMPNRAPNWQGSGYNNMPDMMHYNGPASSYNNSYNMGQNVGPNAFQYKKPFNNAGPNFNRRGRDQRDIIQYRDLDAPEDN